MFPKATHILVVFHVNHVNHDTHLPHTHKVFTLTCIDPRVEADRACPRPAPWNTCASTALSAGSAGDDNKLLGVYFHAAAVTCSQGSVFLPWLQASWLAEHSSESPSSHSCLPAPWLVEPLCMTQWHSSGCTTAAIYLSTFVSSRLQIEMHDKQLNCVEGLAFVSATCWEMWITSCDPPARKTSGEFIMNQALSF